MLYHKDARGLEHHLSGLFYLHVTTLYTMHVHILVDGMLHRVVWKSFCTAYSIHNMDIFLPSVEIHC